MRVNAAILWLLGGPIRRLLPGGLAEISYTGPVSGRTIRFPVQSVADGSRFLVVAGRAEHKRWWRTFRTPHPARLVRGGHGYDVMGEVLTGPQRDAALTTYLAAHPSSRRGLGLQTPVLAFAEVVP